MSQQYSEFCKSLTKSSTFTCLPENLVLIEKIEDFEENEIECLLKFCQICKIVYKEKIYQIPVGTGYSLYYRIPENFVKDCHCIGYLKFIEVKSEKRSHEGDPMYFIWEKETRLQCQKCENYYLEIIYQNNFDFVFYKEYLKEKDDR